MAQKVWTVSLPDGAHLVELQHGTKSGVRKLLVDGAPQPLGRAGTKFFDTGSVHPFQIAGVPCEARIQPRGFGGWHYSLSVDGRPLDAPLPAMRIPLWTGLFVLAALGPALEAARLGAEGLALFLPILLGVGGSIGCIAIASDSSAPVEKRVFRSVLLCGAVWAAALTPALMLRGALFFLRRAS